MIDWIILIFITFLVIISLKFLLNEKSQCKSCNKRKKKDLYDFYFKQKD